MKILTQLLDVLNVAIDSLWRIGQWVMVPLYLLAAFYILSATFGIGENAFEQNTDWEWMTVLAFLFLVPFFIADNTKGKDDHPRLIRFLGFFRVAITMLTVVAGVLWYLYPQNERLEPLMFVYGAIAAWMTYLQNRIGSETQ